MYFGHKTVEQLQNLLSYHVKHSEWSDPNARAEYAAVALEYNGRCGSRAAHVPADLGNAQIQYQRKQQETGWGAGMGAMPSPISSQDPSMIPRRRK